LERDPPILQQHGMILQRCCSATDRHMEVSRRTPLIVARSLAESERDQEISREDTEMSRRSRAAKARSIRLSIRSQDDLSRICVRSRQDEEVSSLREPISR
jgi:hypothetical protein